MRCERTAQDPQAGARVAVILISQVRGGAVPVQVSDEPALEGIDFSGEQGAVGVGEVGSKARGRTARRGWGLLEATLLLPL